MAGATISNANNDRGDDILSTTEFPDSETSDGLSNGPDVNDIYMHDRYISEC